MAFPSGVKVPDLPPQAVPNGPAPAGPFSAPETEPAETPWARFQPGTARPLGSRSQSRSRPPDREASRFGDRYGDRYDRFGDRGRPGRRDVSRPRAAHIPCHLEDAVREMLPDPKTGHKNCRDDGTFDGLYVDCTFGRGGHTQHILQRLSGSGRLIAFDVDPEAVAVARELEARDPRFRIAHRPFSELREELQGHQIDGLLVDLGVSSPQLDDRHRGFGVNEDSELDLRMNQQVGIPAWKWLQQCTTEELAWVIREYGEDGDPLMADRIAEMVMAYVEKRKRMKQQPCRSCRELGEYVKIAKQNFDERGQHPAKLTFQALRMFLNQEMQQLDALLEAACETLKDGGKCVVITFKKRECEAVVKFVRQNEEPQLGRGTMSKARWLELYPIMARDSDWSVTFSRNPIRPRDEDIKENPRTRSALVHVLKKQKRIQQKVLVDDGSAQRSTEERYMKPSYVPTFKGADNNNQNEKGIDEWRQDEWLPKPQEIGASRPESVFPPPEPRREASQPKIVPQVFPPAGPQAQPAQPAQPQPEVHAQPPVKAFPGMQPASAAQVFPPAGPQAQPAQPAQPQPEVHAQPPTKAFPGMQPASAAQVFPPAGPQAQPAQPAAQPQPEVHAQPPTKAFPSSQPAPAPQVYAQPPPKAFPAASGAQAPVTSNFPAAEPAKPRQASPVGPPPPKAFPTGQAEKEATWPPSAPPAKAFPGPTEPSQANPQSPTESKIRFLDESQKAMDAAAIGEGRAVVDLEKLKARKGDLLWILHQHPDGEWLWGAPQKGPPGEERKPAWFLRGDVKVFVDI